MKRFFEYEPNFFSTKLTPFFYKKEIKQHFLTRNNVSLKENYFILGEILYSTPSDNVVIMIYRLRYKQICSLSSALRAKSSRLNK